MKKAIALSLAALALTSGIAACGKKAYEPQTPPQEPAAQSEQTPADNEQSPSDRKNIEITIGGFGMFDKRADLRGVRRSFLPSLAGAYTVEYVHVPYGVTRDETLDYTVNINADNTYTMTVVSSGVRSEHNGRWYARRDNITFFFDEQIDPPEHNVYVADTLYAELLPHGKIMLYDNCHTLVLSKSQDDTESKTERRLQRAQSDNDGANDYGI